MFSFLKPLLEFFKIKEKKKVSHEQVIELDAIDLAKDTYDRLKEMDLDKKEDPIRCKPNKDPKARVVPAKPFVESDNTRHGRDGKYTSKASKTRK